jgi:hypothetical protein
MPTGIESIGVELVTINGNRTVLNDVSESLKIWRKRHKRRGDRNGVRFALEVLLFFGGARCSGDFDGVVRL